MRVLLVLLLFFCVSCKKEESKDSKADAVTAASVDNKEWLPEAGNTYTVLGYNEGLKGVLIKYSDEMYRGGDILSSDGAKLIKSRGIQTIFSVTPSEAIRSFCAAYDIELKEIVFDYQKLGDDQVLTFLNALDSVEYPIYIHCHSGKQRGGNLCAIYREYKEGWEFEKALDEYGKLGGKIEPDREMLQRAYDIILSLKK